MIRVLFVCLGNICRSPMAEAVFNQKVREAGLEEKFEVDSAGTGGWHAGQPAHEGTRRLLRSRDIPIHHRARQIVVDDLTDYDYVITMDGENLANVRALGPSRAVIRPIMDYAPRAGVSEVPDPYYSGNFEEVFELLYAATDGLLASIRREHQL